MGSGFKFGLSGFIWVAQLIALGFLVIGCITAPLISKLGLCKNNGYTYGVFGYCLNGICSRKSANYHVDTVQVGGGWRMGDEVRSKLSLTLIFVPVATVFTFFSVISSFLSQFKAVNRHAFIFLSSLFWMVFSFLTCALVSVTICLMFWPYVTWCVYLLIAATGIHLVCIPLTCVRQTRELQAGDEDSKRHSFLKEEKYETDYALESGQKSNYLNTAYFKLPPTTTGTSDSSKTDFSEGGYGLQGLPVKQESYQLRSISTNTPTVLPTSNTESLAQKLPYPIVSTERLNSRPLTSGFNGDVSLPYPTVNTEIGFNPPHMISTSPGQSKQLLIPDKNSITKSNNYADYFQRDQIHQKDQQSYLELGFNSEQNTRFNGSNRKNFTEPSHYNFMVQKTDNMNPILQGYSSTNTSFQNSKDSGKNDFKSHTNTLQGPIGMASGMPTGSEWVSSQPQSLIKDAGISSITHELEDEEFIRQNTIDPRERPQLEEDDGIEDDRSNFTSVSQRGVNPYYYTNGRVPENYYSSPLLLQKQDYVDPGFHLPHGPNCTMKPTIQTGQYIGPQQTPKNGLYQTPSDRVIRTQDASDILLQNSLYFMLDEAPSNNTSKNGLSKGFSQPQTPTLNLQGSYYKPAYKKRLQKTKAIKAPSLSRDSPYSCR